LTVSQGKVGAQNRWCGLYCWQKVCQKLL